MASADFTVADKLDEARALIEKGWCQGPFNDREQRDTPTCFCALGAIAEVHGHRIGEMELGEGVPNFSRIKAASVFRKTLGVRGYLGTVRRRGRRPSTVAAWNDAPERTQAEVIAAFKRAAELARAERVQS